MRKVLFYGSLRKGEYNHKRFVQTYGEKNILYKGTKKIKGFKLFDLGAYPAVIRTNGAADTLVVDEFLVSPEVYSSIHNMELGAGYRTEEENGATIYTFAPDRYPHIKHRVVASGDWSMHLKSVIH